MKLSQENSVLFLITITIATTTSEAAAYAMTRAAMKYYCPRT
jgi:hypothetical protein